MADTSPSATAWLDQVGSVAVPQVVIDAVVQAIRQPATREDDVLRAIDAYAKTTPWPMIAGALVGRTAICMLADWLVQQLGTEVAIASLTMTALHIEIDSIPMTEADGA